MYNDARASNEAQKIAQIAPAESAVHSATSALAKLMWFSEDLPPKATYALHQADWVAAKLGAQPGCSDENNALKLGYDPIHQSWPKWLTQLLTPDSQALLPQVVSVGSPIGQVSSAWLARWNLTHPIKLLAGTTDSNAAALASGITMPGQACTSLGSTLVLKLISDRPIFAPEYGVYSHRIGNQWLVGGASNTGGQVLLEYFSPEQMKVLERKLDPAHETGSDYYPLLKPGERFPENAPNKKPRLSPRPASDLEFFQGLLESMARIEARGYQLLHTLGAPKVSHIMSAGGGSQNNAWQTLRRRYTGVPVQRALHTEAAYGSALIALKGAGVIQ